MPRVTETDEMPPVPAAVALADTQDGRQQVTEAGGDEGPQLPAGHLSACQGPSRWAGPAEGAAHSQPQGRLSWLCLTYGCEQVPPKPSGSKHMVPLQLRLSPRVRADRAGHCLVLGHPAGHPEGLGRSPTVGAEQKLVPGPHPPSEAPAGRRGGAARGNKAGALSYW